MVLRCLQYQAPPPGVILDYYYCEQHTAGMDRHVPHYCAPFRATILRALVELIGREMPTGDLDFQNGDMVTQRGSNLTECQSARVGAARLRTIAVAPPGEATTPAA